jgi:uncharacterized protein (DUF885 family)
MSDVFEVADRFVDELCEMRPIFATFIGVEGHDDEWGDTGLAGIEAQKDFGLRYRDLFAAHLDETEFLNRLAARVTLGTIEERLASYDAGDHFRDLRHMGCTFHQLRNTFDVMPTETAEHWDNIISRLDNLGKAYDGYMEVLDEGRRRGVTVAGRQAESVARQAEALAGDASSYLLLLQKARKTDNQSDRLEAAIDEGRAQAARFSEWLTDVYLPDSAEEEAAGRELYMRSADEMVGMAVDPEEAYRWGWDEFHRILDEMSEVGERIAPGSSFEEVKEHLETDPETTVDSRDELVDFVSELLAGAVDDLAGTHFEVPDPIRPITVQIAPPGGPLGVYYVAPSEDFSRPGGVWYAIGDQTRFPLYQHVSTAYHEGFPGHHLQIATARYRSDRLSRAHRLLTWYPGYGEGWAMYAEVLMGELGYLDDPRYHFGMLAKQMYRAARVVVDIGLHLKKQIAGTSPLSPGESWSFDIAVEFMRIYGFRTPAQAEAEVLRYLGWPGQAIAYKLGERELLSIREEARQRLGADFDLKAFHGSILNHGTMRLDMLGEISEELLDEGSAAG